MMLTTIIVVLVVGWMALCCVVCVAACMASSRFSAQVERQEFDHRRSVHMHAPHRRMRRPDVVRMEGNAAPVKIELG